MPATSLLPADRVDPAALCDLFNRCFAGYFTPAHLDAAGLTAMGTVFDVDWSASRVLETEGGAAAFAFLAIRGPAGWIGGMGVVPEARGRGLGRVVMDSAIEAARERGLSYVDLEVIEQNRRAADLYQTMGFQDRRRLGVWERPAQAPPPPAPGVRALPPRDAVTRRRLLGEEELPWQRAVTVMEKSLGVLEASEMEAASGRTAGAEPGACVLFRRRPDSVQVLDLVPGAGGAEALENLLRAILSVTPPRPARCLNLPGGGAAARALLGAGFAASFWQREMRLTLRG